MCNASGTSYWQRIHVFSVPILTHQETVSVNGYILTAMINIFNSCRSWAQDQHVNILSIVRGKRVNIQHP